VGSVMIIFNIKNKILADHVGNDTVVVKEAADRLGLLGAGVLYGSDHPGHLIILVAGISGILLSSFLLLVLIPIIISQQEQEEFFCLGMRSVCNYLKVLPIHRWAAVWGKG
jgi:hypothetical protein